MARADIHVFGSISGYGTVAASSGVRPDETRELEHFQFGEISTSEAIAQLGSRPTMTVRPLASGRVAISRMIPAGADDAGRPTIEVVTLLVDARGAEAVLPALDRLVSDVGFWREARERSRSGVELPEGAIPAANPRDSSLLRILDAWLLATRSGSVAVLPESAMPDLLRFVATLDPADRIGCRWGVGINSLSAPVDICTMMSGASTHGARAVVRPATADRWYVQETEVARANAADGAATWRATAQLVGRATATSVVGGLGDPTDAFASGSPRSDIDERRKRVMLISMLAAVCATGLLATATALYLSGPSAKRSELADVTERDGVEPSGTLATPPPPEGTQRSGFGGEISSGSEQVASTVADPIEVLAPGSLPPQLTPPLAPIVPQLVVYRDVDRDEFGSATDSRLVDPAAIPGGYVRVGGDCDDNNPKAYPNAPETCDDVGVDNDCDNDPRDADGEVATFYLDEDGDFKGDPLKPCDACISSPPPGYVGDSSDQCPRNSLRDTKGVCGCEWEGPDKDSDEDGVMDCMDEDFDEKRRLRNELLEAAKSASALSIALDTELKKCRELSHVSARQDKDFLQKARARASSLNGLLLDVDPILQRIYRARLLGRFGSVRFVGRELDPKERLEVNALLLGLLQDLEAISNSFGAIVDLKVLPPPPPDVEILRARRLDPEDPEVGWSKEEFKDRKLCEWALELFYNANVREEELSRAKSVVGRNSPSR